MDEGRKEQPGRSSRRRWLVGVAILLMIGLALLGLALWTGRLLEPPGQVFGPGGGPGSPSINLDPIAAPPGAAVTVTGAGWPVDSTVLIYLSVGEGTAARAVASTVPDEAGQFTTGFVIPSDAAYQNKGLTTVLARVKGSSLAATRFMTVMTRPAGPAGEQAVSARTDVVIRTGPGLNYPSNGVLPARQEARVTGRSVDGGWLQIKPPAAAEAGWVPAELVTAGETFRAPVVEAPSLPTATPPPTAPPPPTATPPPTPTPEPAATPEPPPTPLPTSTPEPTATPSPTSTPPPTPVPDMASALRAAIRHLAGQANVPEGRIQTLSVESVLWPTPALGCLAFGQDSQTPVAGFKIILGVDGQMAYEYHTDQVGNLAVLCDTFALPTATPTLTHTPTDTPTGTSTPLPADTPTPAPSTTPTLLPSATPGPLPTGASTRVPTPTPTTGI